MKWIENFRWLHEWNESHEIMVQDLPEWLKFDYEIWSANDKYLIKSGKKNISEAVKWCNIYHIRIPSNYDYESVENEISNLGEEMQMKLKQEWIKRYQEENKVTQPSRKKRIERKIEKRHLQEVESIREKRKIDWREDEREIELEKEIKKEQEEREWKIREKFIDLAYQDIEKFKEYTSIYNLIKNIIKIKKEKWEKAEFNDIDFIIIEDTKSEKKLIHVQTPRRLTEKFVKFSIKMHIRSILRQWYLIDDNTYKEIIEDYSNEIYDLFRITVPEERNAKLEELKTSKPAVVAIWNSYEKKFNNITSYSRPSSWPEKYDKEVENLKEKNTVYEVKY